MKKVLLLESCHLSRMASVSLRKIPKECAYQASFVRLLCLQRYARELVREKYDSGKDELKKYNLLFPDDPI